MYNPFRSSSSSRLTRSSLRVLRCFSSSTSTSSSSTAFNARPRLITNHDRLIGVPHKDGHPLKIQVRHNDHRVNLGTPSYEGDGKTTVTILNHEIDSPLMVDSVNENGFNLNNGMSVVGPIALFPKLALSWDVSSVDDINPQSLSLFLTLEPKLDILVIGMGAAGNTLNPETFKFLRERKIAVEALSTEFAIQTFNYIAPENRCVGAALIPPVVVTRGYIDDELEDRLRREKLYTPD